MQRYGPQLPRRRCTIPTSTSTASYLLCWAQASRRLSILPSSVFASFFLWQWLIVNVQTTAGEISLLIGYLLLKDVCPFGVQSLIPSLFAISRPPSSVGSGSWNARLHNLKDLLDKQQQNLLIPKSRYGNAISSSVVTTRFPLQPSHILRPIRFWFRVPFD